MTIPCLTIPPTSSFAFGGPCEKIEIIPKDFNIRL